MAFSNHFKKVLINNGSGRNYLGDKRSYNAAAKTSSPAARRFSALLHGRRTRIPAVGYYVTLKEAGHRSGEMSEQTEPQLIVKLILAKTSKYIHKINT